MHKLDGTWDLVVHTFVGDQTSVLEFKVEGDTLTGTTTDKNSGNSSELFNGKVEGDAFTYQASVKLPMGLIEFTMSGTVDEAGTAITGTSRNAMGEFPFEGTRRA